MYPALALGDGALVTRGKKGSVGSGRSGDQSAEERVKGIVVLQACLANVIGQQEPVASSRAVRIATRCWRAAEADLLVVRL